MIEIALSVLAAGAFAGLLAGMFGVGGGLVMVPVLVGLFQYIELPSALHMHVALGSSLATIALTALSSVRAHHQRGAVRWTVVRDFLPGIALGAVFGAVLADSISSDHLRIGFGVAELLIAARMLMAGQPAPGRSLPGRLGMALVGSVVGAISSLAGIGGGTMTVPYLAWCNVPMATAVATSAANGLPIAVFGAAGYVVMGWGASGLPPGSSGYVYWPGVAGLAVASVVFAPLGAMLAHRLPASFLQRAFAAVLIVFGIRMLWF